MKENNMLKYLLENWENHTDLLTEYFIEKYFGKLEDVEYYWVADDVGGVLAVADYFFNLSDIIDFIKYHYSKDLMFEYYDYALDYHMQTKHKKSDYLINIKNYKELEHGQNKKGAKLREVPVRRAKGN
jgi:hypothetical protein